MIRICSWVSPKQRSINPVIFYFIYLISSRSWSQMLDPLHPVAFMEKADSSTQILFGESWCHGSPRCNKRYETLLDMQLVRVQHPRYSLWIGHVCILCLHMSKFQIPRGKGHVQTKPYVLHSSGAINHS